MDLDEFRRSLKDLSDAELQKERADLMDRIRKAKRNAALRYDEEQYAEFQTFEVKLKLVQEEIDERIKEDGK